jgi:hypothetical protein
MNRWIPIESNACNIHGYYRVRYPDGLRVEVVRCYAGEWAIFTYRNGEMTDECRNPSCDRLAYQTALHRARLILQGREYLL